MQQNTGIELGGDRSSIVKKPLNIDSGELMRKLGEKSRNLGVGDKFGPAKIGRGSDIHSDLAGKLEIKYFFDNQSRDGSGKRRVDAVEGCYVAIEDKSGENASLAKKFDGLVFDNWYEAQAYMTQEYEKMKGDKA